MDQLWVQFWIMLKTSRTTLHRRAERGSHDPLLIHAILDDAYVCHVGLAQDGFPVVIPMAFVRMGESVMLHGAPSGRLVEQLSRGAPVCVTVTLLDGLVLARSAFHHSLNYRSVVLFGKATPLKSREEKQAALNALLERISPGRSCQARVPTDAELDGTTVLSIPITEASAKVREGGPIDDERDLTFPVWAGVIPLQLVHGTPIVAGNGHY